MNEVLIIQTDTGQKQGKNPFARKKRERIFLEYLKTLLICKLFWYLS